MCADTAYRSLRGFSDILAREAELMTVVEGVARRVLRTFGYEEIRLPHLELTEVFTRSIGESTDIVEKEMYAFTDRGGKHVALRPEGTASVVRAFIQHIWDNTPDVHKLFYSGAMFRGERPQKGRKREFYQIGAEMIGGSGPHMDAELVLTLDNIFRALGVRGQSLMINCLGCREDQSSYKGRLGDFLVTRQGELCDNCRRRSATNVLRVLDCKAASCSKVVEDAPRIDKSVCSSCRAHYGKVKDLLVMAGVEFEERPSLVRGLDYYTGFVFEVEHDKLGAQSAVAAGGRYDNLSEAMGGPDTGACGYAIGLERLLFLVDDEKFRDDPDGVLVLAPSEEFLDKAFQIAGTLWRGGINCRMDHSGRSFKGQLRRANREGGRYVLIVGEETRDGSVVLKDMQDGSQELIALAETERVLKKIVGCGSGKRRV